MKRLTKEVQSQLNDLLRQNARFMEKLPPKKQKSKWWPRFSCSPLCGYTHEMRRPHWTCPFFCRLRRFFYGRMDPKKYHWNRYVKCVYPQDQTTYVLIIDNQRRLRNVKAALLKRLLTICEWLAN